MQGAIMKKIVITLLLLNTFSFGKMFDIGTFSKKLVGKNLDKVSRTIKKSNFTKNLPDIILSKSLKPEVSLVIKVANIIAQKGDFEDKFISTTKYPTEVIRQYSKYGDGYLNTIKTFNQKVLSLSADAIKQLKDRFSSMPNVTFKTSQAFNDKFVMTLKYTGKKGWEASQSLMRLAEKHPKSTAVAGLYAWYVSDPESFFEQKSKLIDFVESLLNEATKDSTKIVLGASNGITTGLMEGIKERATLSNVVGLFLALLLLVLWRLRTYIEQFFKIKLENRLQKERYREEEGTF